MALITTPKMPLGNNSLLPTTKKLKKKLKIEKYASEYASNTRYTARKERFQLQKKISNLLMQNTEYDDFRSTKFCFSRPLKYLPTKTGLLLENKTIDINYSTLKQKASYSKVFLCGNVWICPVCSTKINIKRSKEIAKAIEYGYENGYKIAMLTFTNPHNKKDKLKDIIDKHNLALQKVFASTNSTSYFYRRINNPNKYRITAREVTYGKNGWHWHTHILMFVGKDADITKEYDYLFRRWYRYCLEVGFNISNVEAFKSYGLDIITNMSSSQYLTKYGKFWGIDKEFTNREAKQPKNGNIPPFQLIDAGYEKQFLEYAYATKLRKQIMWSRGLKALCGVKEKTDEELAQEREEKANNIKVAEIDYNLWQEIKEKHLEAKILQMTEIYGDVGLRCAMVLSGLAEYIPKMNINNIPSPEYIRIRNRLT